MATSGLACKGNVYTSSKTCHGHMAVYSSLDSVITAYLNHIYMYMGDRLLPMVLT